MTSWYSGYWTKRICDWGNHLPLWREVDGNLEWAIPFKITSCSWRWRRKMLFQKTSKSCSGERLTWIIWATLWRSEIGVIKKVFALTLLKFFHLYLVNLLKSLMNQIYTVKNPQMLYTPTLLFCTYSSSICSFLPVYSSKFSFYVPSFIFNFPFAPLNLHTSLYLLIHSLFHPF